MIKKILKVSLIVIGFIFLAHIAVDTFAQDQITNRQQAEEIALKYLGVGQVIDTFEEYEEGVLLYVVHILDESVNYHIYIDARDGNVLRMVREEPGFQGIMTLPGLIP